MDLQQFINYRETCPLCQHKLAIDFRPNSRKKHRTRHVDNKLQFIFELDSLKKGSRDHEAAYCFDPQDSSFCVEFYTKKQERYLNLSPHFLMVRFRQLHSNFTDFFFHRNCYNCRRYQYNSEAFHIKLKEKYITDLSIHSERIGLIHPVGDEYRVYKITNDYSTNTTRFSVDKVSQKVGVDVVSAPRFVADPTIELPFIPFTSEEKMISRLNNLLIFT